MPSGGGARPPVCWPRTRQWLWPNGATHLGPPAAQGCRDRPRGRPSSLRHPCSPRRAGQAARESIAKPRLVEIHLPRHADLFRDKTPFDFGHLDVPQLLRRRTRPKRARTRHAPVAFIRHQCQIHGTKRRLPRPLLPDRRMHRTRPDLGFGRRRTDVAVRPPGRHRTGRTTASEEVPQGNANGQEDDGERLAGYPDQGFCQYAAKSRLLCS